MIASYITMTNQSELTSRLNSSEIEVDIQRRLQNIQEIVGTFLHLIVWEYLPAGGIISLKKHHFKK